MERAAYSAPIANFLNQAPEAILGILAESHAHDLVQKQTGAWRVQIDILKNQLAAFTDGHVFFEFVIPRMGKRADVILVISGLVFVVEFKVGANEYARHDKEQALDYALDLKNFHEGSHRACLIPILLATDAPLAKNGFSLSEDVLAGLLCSNKLGLAEVVKRCINVWHDKGIGSALAWANSPYKPTPTIIQAAQALYQGHKVE